LRESRPRSGTPPAKQPLKLLSRQDLPSWACSDRGGVFGGWSQSEGHCSAMTGTDLSRSTRTDPLSWDRHLCRKRTPLVRDVNRMCDHTELCRESTYRRGTQGAVLHRSGPDPTPRSRACRDVSEAIVRGRADTPVRQGPPVPLQPQLRALCAADPHGSARPGGEAPRELLRHRSPLLRPHPAPDRRNMRGRASPYDHEGRVRPPRRSWVDPGANVPKRTSSPARVSSGLAPVAAC
jgi:hypothetical protein